MTGYTPFNDGGDEFETPVYAGSRVLDIGGIGGFGNLIQSNTITYGGADPDMPGAITLDNGGLEIVRFNTVVGAAGNAIQVYGKGDGGIAGSNYIYNNSSMFSGFCTYFLASTGAPTTVDYPAWQNSYAFASTSNNFLINNLDYWSFTNTWRFADGISTDIKWMANNMTTVNPLWVNTKNTVDQFVPWPADSPPDFQVESGSPALEAGTWIAYITSATGSGASFVATNAAAFWPGTTAAWRTIPGDRIQFQGVGFAQIGGTQYADITAIDGNTITVASSITSWTNTQGIAIPYSGPAPDVGAY
jgi:hypothetical protein